MLNIGHSLIYLPKTDSTNKEAFRILETRDLEHGTIIITSEQYAGRGQGDASWESEPGKNLTFSLVLRPLFLEVAKQFMITKVISLALCDVIKTLADPIPVFIKWPNDIYINDKKAAGILIENRIMGSVFQLCIIGIGINLNQKSFHSNAPNPVSVSGITNKTYSLNEVLEKVCIALNKRYLQLVKNKAETLDNDYLNNLLGYRQKRSFLSQDKEFSARIMGVNEFGKLILEDDSGKTREFFMKEIKFLF